MTTPVRVSVKVKAPPNDESASDDSVSDSSSSESSDHGTKAKVAKSSYSSDSGSSEDDSSSDSDELCDRQQVLDKIDELEGQLKEHRAHAEALADELMPLPTICDDAACVMPLWNGMLSDALFGMKRGRTGDAPVLLRADTAPPQQEAVEYTGALAAARKHKAAKDAVSQVAEAHDALLKCVRVEQDLALKKFKSDYGALKQALQQLTRYHAQVLRKQRAEESALNSAEGSSKKALVTVPLAAESKEAATLIAALPSWVPQRELWLTQVRSGATDTELLLILETILEVATPMDPEDWQRMITDLQEDLKGAADVTPDVVHKMKQLESSAGACSIKKALLSKVRSLHTRVLGMVAAAADQRTTLKNEMYVVRNVRQEEIQELYAAFMKMRERLADACLQVLDRNQTTWRSAMANLQLRCVLPLREHTMPAGEAALLDDALLAFRELRLQANRAVDSARADAVEAIVEGALSYVPKVQRVRDEYVALQGDLLGATQGQASSVESESSVSESSGSRD